MSELSPKAVVVVPTFKRPAMLRETLRSLEAQIVSFPFAVVVVENDAKGSEGRVVADQVFASGALAGQTVVEANPGNVQAINTGFRTALEAYEATDLFLMIDDDEVASPGWLQHMVDAAEGSGSGIVGGPVNPEFDRPLGKGLREHPVFWPIKAESGPLPMIYGSGNCLIRRDVFEKLGFFDLRFNFLGGGDLDFFTRARHAGVGFYWAAEALVTERVPETRTRTDWVLKRGLRIGAVNRSVDRKMRPGAAGGAQVALKDAAILALAPYRFARELVRSRSVLLASHQVVVAVGRVLSVAGVETAQYRITSK